MAEVASAYVSLLPSAKGFGRSLDGQISGDLTSSGKKAGSRFGGAMKAGLLGVAGLAAGAGALAGKIIGDSIGEAREAQKVGAVTEQIIKSTGGAAKITAKQVGDMAGRLSGVTGIDDEVIQQGSNLLLTFKNVKNYVDGQFVGVFDRATAAAVDLSAAGFGSVDGSAKMLGKALNDPVKGISALGRAGVTFTADQQKLIKSLVETGDSAGAQALILKEVESQVGGVAAASATAGEKASVAFGNLKEDLGTRLLPVVDKVLTFFTEKGVPAVTRFMDSLGKGSPIIKTVGGFIQGTLLPPIQDLAGWVMNSLVPAIMDFARDALPGVKSALGSVQKGLKSAQPFFEFLGNVVTDILLPVLGKLARTILPVLGDQIEILGKAFGALGRIGTALWNKALQPAFKFIVGAIANILDMWSSMLGTLAKVPGFGWAKKAADAMAGAAAKAREVADGIKKIPPIKNVRVNVVYAYQGQRNAAKENQLDFNPRTGGAGIPPRKTFLAFINKNYGDAGTRLIDVITKGIKAATPKTVKAAEDAFAKIQDKLTSTRDGLKGTLDGLKDDFKSLADSVSSAFTGDLFNPPEGTSFIDNLIGKKSELTGLLASFKTLQGWGLPGAFLSQLFASGNGALITELAGMGKNGAMGAANLFGDVQSLSKELGNSVAAGDPVAAAIDETNKQLVAANLQLSFLAEDIGKELNGAASRAHRNRKNRGKK